MTASSSAARRLSTSCRDSHSRQPTVTRSGRAYRSAPQSGHGPQYSRAGGGRSTARRARSTASVISLTSRQRVAQVVACLGRAGVERQADLGRTRADSLPAPGAPGDRVVEVVDQLVDRDQVAEQAAGSTTRRPHRPRSGCLGVGGGGGRVRHRPRAGYPARKIARTGAGNRNQCDITIFGVMCCVLSVPPGTVAIVHDHGRGEVAVRLMGKSRRDRPCESTPAGPLSTLPLIHTSIADSITASMAGRPGLDRL